jgi:hypothetical protein
MEKKMIASKEYLESRNMTVPPKKYNVGDVVDGCVVTEANEPSYHICIGWTQSVHFDGGHHSHQNATIMHY